MSGSFLTPHAVAAKGSTGLPHTKMKMILLLGRLRAQRPQLRLARLVWARRLVMVRVWAWGLRPRAQGLFSHAMGEISSQPNTPWPSRSAKDCQTRKTKKIILLLGPATSTVTAPSAGPNVGTETCDQKSVVSWEGVYYGLALPAALCSPPFRSVPSLSLGFLSWPRLACGELVL